MAAMAAGAPGGGGDFPPGGGDRLVTKGADAPGQDPSDEVDVELEDFENAYLHTTPSDIVQRPWRVCPACNRHSFCKARLCLYPPCAASLVDPKMNAARAFGPC